ncbi:hypothetical protein [Kitasatospora sp. NPDC127116]|uniref:hypothetical protein n=1 Tax=unclassified Kitasatospora TaxID=2633591 RepID=UPI00363D264C
MTDMLTVAVFDAELFDEMFQRILSTNDEGHRIGLEVATGRSTGIPFTADQADRLACSEPMQPAGATLLRLAWRHQDVLLQRSDAGGSGDAHDLRGSAGEARRPPQEARNDPQPRVGGGVKDLDERASALE